MAQRIKLAAAFFGVYLLGVATPYLANYTLAVVVQHIGGQKEFSPKTSPNGVLAWVKVAVDG